MTRPIPGRHLALVSADRRVVVVPGGEDAVGALWPLLVAPPAPDLFERLLDAVLGLGLAGRPGFALAVEQPDGLRVAVRGVWRAEAGGGEPVCAAGGEGWREVVLPRGVGLSLVADDLEEDDGLPSAPVDLPPGPVALRVGGVAWSAVAAAPSPAPVPPMEAPAPFDPLTVPLSALLAGPAPHPEPGLAPDVVPGPDAVRPVLRLSAGAIGEIALDRPVVLGRAPQRVGPDGEEEVRLVAVPSPHHEISSTHLEIRPGLLDPLVATVTDLGSTNGTLVLRPGEPPLTLRPGIPAALAPGTVVDLGDGLTIELAIGA